MKNVIQKSNVRTVIETAKDTHPVLMQAFYVVPRSLRNDAWWLVDDFDVCSHRSPVLGVCKIKGRPKS